MKRRLLTVSAMLCTFVVSKLPMRGSRKHRRPTRRARSNFSTKTSTSTLGARQVYALALVALRSIVPVYGAPLTGPGSSSGHKLTSLAVSSAQAQTR